MADARYAPGGDHHSAPNENVLDTTLKALFARRGSHYGPKYARPTTPFKQMGPGDFGR